MIKNLSGINTNCEEGRLFIGALAKITTELHTDKTPDEVISMCNDLSLKMFDTPLPTQENIEKPDFVHALSSLINSYSKENGSNTPDFVLAEYLEGCLKDFDAATNQRTNWYKPAH
jgi:hypothetical protein